MKIIFSILNPKQIHSLFCLQKGWNKISYNLSFSAILANGSSTEANPAVHQSQVYDSLQWGGPHTTGPIGYHKIKEKIVEGLEGKGGFM